MSAQLSRAEAADRLQEITTAGERSARLYGYRAASPHLIWWGIIWAIGYGASGWSQAGNLWVVLVILGLVGSMVLGARQHPRRRGGSSWRFAAASLAVAGFLTALFAIVVPITGEQVGTVVPLLVALAYVLQGIYSNGTRMWATGLAIGVLTVGGYFWMPQAFGIWMAVAGGGGLILGGLWLRSA